MGRAYTQYSFPDSGANDVFNLYSAFVMYHLENGLELHVRQVDCWCNICSQIGMAEKIDSVADLQAEIDSLMDPDEEEKEFIAFIGLPIEDRIQEANLRLQWRRGRASPAKCLTCGESDFVVLPDQDEFLHPATGERVRVVGRGFADAAPWHAQFTPEGVRIRSEESRL